MGSSLYSNPFLMFTTDPPSPHIPAPPAPPPAHPLRLPSSPDTITMAMLFILTVSLTDTVSVTARGLPTTRMCPRRCPSSPSAMIPSNFKKPKTNIWVFPLGLFFCCCCFEKIEIMAKALINRNTFSFIFPVKKKKKKKERKGKKKAEKENKGKKENK